MPAEGSTVTLTVRPEKFTLHAGAEPRRSGDANLLRGEVIQPVYMGASITYRVRAGGTELTVFHQNRESTMLQPGETVWLAWAPRHSILLDRD